MALVVVSKVVSSTTRSRELRIRDLEVRASRKARLGKSLLDGRKRDLGLS
jgi:hypothetical protein